METARPEDDALAALAAAAAAAAVAAAAVAAAEAAEALASSKSVDNLDTWKGKMIVDVLIINSTDYVNTSSASFWFSSLHLS